MFGIQRRLEKDLRRLGVEEGMSLMVHSSLRKIGANVENGAEAVIETLLDLIGPRGTLIVPTITGNVRPDQPVFHVEYTPSTVGYLTNVFRMREDAVRSLHPVHSVAAIGPLAEYFTTGHLAANTPWSPETPYGRIVRDENCSILFLGVNLDYNSCFHALEIEARLPGMHTASNTTLHIIDKSGREHTVEHHWHDKTERFFADMEGLLSQGGCLNVGRTARGVSRLVQSVPMRSIILDLLNSEPWLMTRPPEKNDFVWEP